MGLLPRRLAGGCARTSRADGQPAPQPWAPQLDIATKGRLFDCRPGPALPERDGGRGDARSARERRSGRQPWNSTTVPSLTSRDSSSTSQFVRRTQPWLWRENSESGSGVPCSP